VFGDSAFSCTRPEAAIRTRGGTPRIVHTSTWGGAEALARLEAHNAEVRRMRWRGLAKAGLQVRLAAMACNLRRSWRLLAGVPG